MSVPSASRGYYNIAGKECAGGRAGGSIGARRMRYSRIIASRRRPAQMAQNPIGLQLVASETRSLSWSWLEQVSLERAAQQPAGDVVAQRVEPKPTTIGPLSAPLVAQSRTELMMISRKLTKDKTTGAYFQLDLARQIHFGARSLASGSLRASLTESDWKASGPCLLALFGHDLPPASPINLDSNQV